MANLYNIVADKIRAFCQATYYSSVIASFDQSYDGKDWEHQVEFASFENDDFETVVFDNDWCEGQSHIRNLKVWHLEDSGEVVRCRDCKHRGTTDCTSYNAFWELGDDGFCSVGERKEE